MRKRTLSKEGMKLYSTGMRPPRRRSWAQILVCSVFHSDYDDHLLDVVIKCRKSTQALAAQFNHPKIRERLDAAVLHTIRLILTCDKKKIKKRHVLQTFRFFVDVMERAYHYEDHQTAHMLYLALTHPAIAQLNLKMRKNDEELIKGIGREYGEPSYAKHIKFWCTVRSDNVLPSLIAFHIFITRREFMGRLHEANEARQIINIFEFLEHNPDDILPLYSQKRLSNEQMISLSKKILK